MDTPEALYDGRSQLKELARLALKARKSLRWGIPLALIIAAALGAYSQVRSGSYTSEAVAVIRPQTSPERVSATADAQSGKSAEVGGPIPLGVTDYRLLLTSDMLLEEVVNDYNQRFAGESGPVGLGAVRKMLYAEERLKLKTPYNVEYYPTLQMQATAPSPDQAYWLLDSWIKAAKGWASRVTVDAKQDVYEYVDQEFESARSELVSLEELLNTEKATSADLVDQLVEENLQKEEDHILETITLKRELSDEWDDKIAEAKQEYQLETLSRRNTLSDEWDQKIMTARAEFNLPFHEANVDHLIAQSLKLEAQLGTVELDLAEARARMSQLEEQRKQHPEMLVLAKAITDDALWESRSQDKRLESLKLRTEEVNPVMTAIKNDVRATEVQLAALPARQERLKSDLDGATSETVTEQSYVYSSRLNLDLMERAKASALEALDIERTLGLSLLTEKLMRQKEGAIRALEASRDNGLTLVKRKGETAVAKLERERNFTEQRVQRDLDTQAGIFDSLTSSRLRAKMAVANTIEEFDVLSSPTLQAPKQASLVGGTIIGVIAFIVATVGFFALSVIRIFLSELAATAEEELEKSNA
jgi:hypothetical protein